MDKQLKEYWLDALREGEYVQGRSALEREGRNCCLGVLVDVMGIDRVLVDPQQPVSFFDSAGNLMRVSLTDTVLTEAGLSWGETSILIRLNDNQRCTFEEIADYIEYTL